MLRLKVTPVVGLPQFTGWSQVAESTVSVSARLIVVFAISGKHAGNVGRDISEKVSDFYYYDAQQFHEFLQQLISYAHTNECKIYFACAILARQKSIFATYGGSVFLKRAEKSGKIVSSEEEVRLIEGTYQPDDVFVLTTVQADQFLSEIQLKFQQGYDTDIIITSVVPGLHAQTDSSLSALVFISKDDEKVEQTESLETNSPFFAVEADEESGDESEVKHADVRESLDSGTAKFQETLAANSLLQKTESLESAYESREQFHSGESQSYMKQGEHITTSGSGLAEVSLEVSPIVVPGVIQKLGSVLQPIFRVMLQKSMSLIKKLLRICKKLLFKLWLKTRQINLKELPQLLTDIRSRGIQPLSGQYKISAGDLRPQKKMFKVIVSSILLLVLLGFLGFWQYQRAAEAKTMQSTLAPIQLEIAQAKEISVTDPIAAREIVAALIDKLAQIESEYAKSSSIGLVTTQKNELMTYLESISGREELQELEVFYDLRLAKSDFIATGIDVASSTLLVYDREMKQVLLLDAETKQIRLRDFSGRSDFESAVLLEEYSFVLSDGVYKFKNSFVAETELETVREAGDSNISAALLDAYDRYVYVINPEKRNIYRYAQEESGYSEPVGWMKSATGIQYENLRSISVDGDVWLTTSDGQIKKFTSGREESFELRGLDVGFTSDIYAYTNEKLERIFVLDPGNNRIVFFDKNGAFLKEIKSVSFGAASGLTVSEELGKIFVSSGSVIYQVGL